MEYCDYKVENGKCLDVAICFYSDNIFPYKHARCSYHIGFNSIHPKNVCTEVMRNGDICRNPSYDGTDRCLIHMETCQTCNNKKLIVVYGFKRTHITQKPLKEFKFDTRWCGVCEYRNMLTIIPCNTCKKSFAFRNPIPDPNDTPYNSENLPLHECNVEDEEPIKEPCED